MKVDLDRNEIIVLLKSTEAPDELWEDRLISKMGRFDGNRWIWGSKIYGKIPEDISDTILFDVYKRCKSLE